MTQTEVYLLDISPASFPSYSTVMFPGETTKMKTYQGKPGRPGKPLPIFVNRYIRSGMVEVTGFSTEGNIDRLIHRLRGSEERWTDLVGGGGLAIYYLEKVDEEDARKILHLARHVERGGVPEEDVEGRETLERVVSGERAKMADARA